MTDNPKVTAAWRAAQCWCDPTTSRKVMDIELCLVIAKAIKSAEDSARAEGYEAALKDVRIADGAEVKKLDALASAYRLGYSEALEQAAKVVRGEIEIYEEQSKRVTKSRMGKIQGRWKKLKDIENRIHSLKLSPTPSDEKGGAA